MKEESKRYSVDNLRDMHQKPVRVFFINNDDNKSGYEDVGIIQMDCLWDIYPCDSDNGVYVHGSFYSILDYEKTWVAYPYERTGYWVYNENSQDWGLGGWECSECNTRNNALPVTKNMNPMFFACSHFCPQCGARILGVKDS